MSSGLADKKLTTIAKRALFTSSTQQESHLQDGDNSDERQQAKRMELEAHHTSSIIEICTTQSATTFEGNVLVAYGPAYAKNPSSPAKAQIVHVDLLDSQGQMTITANITNQLIDTFLPRLLPGASVCITNFTIKKKAQYERGDSDYCLQLTADTSIQAIDKVCKQQKLMPDTAISKLIHSPSTYSVGTLGVIVAAHSQTPNEYQLQVKDGESMSDTDSLTVPKYLVDAYATLQNIFTTTHTPFLLLKNVVRSGPRGMNTIKTTPATFIDNLNDDSTTNALQKLATSNFQVIGTLKLRNAYLAPYQLLCTSCHQPASSAQVSSTNNAQCITCAKNTTFRYQPFLQCIIETEDDIVDCTLNGKLLEQHFPDLGKIPFDNYKKTSSMVSLVRNFEIASTFTIAMNNNIISIALRINNNH